MAAVIVQTVGAALDLAINLLSQSQSISQIVAGAQKENRTMLSDAEWAQIDAATRQADDHIASSLKTHHDLPRAQAIADDDGMPQGGK